MGIMAKNTPFYGLAPARTVRDPNPRDPGSGTNHIVNLAFRSGPQPRDDGKSRQYGNPPRPVQPRDPPQRPRPRGRLAQPRDAGY